MKIFNILLVAFTSLFSQSNQACTIPISKITITDNSIKSATNVIQIIEDKMRLSSIQATWCDFQKIDFPPNADWSHGIKIEGGDMEGIWLYNQKGYVSRLNYQLKPSFHIPDPEAFNRLLGI
jgi:hypothetical protein